MDAREVCSLGSARGPRNVVLRGRGGAGQDGGPKAWRPVESEIVPDLEHSNNHGGKNDALSSPDD
jgi:hypothetical protein